MSVNGVLFDLMAGDIGDCKAGLMFECGSGADAVDGMLMTTFVSAMNEAQV